MFSMRTYISTNIFIIQYFEEKCIKNIYKSVRYKHFMFSITNIHFFKNIRDSIFWRKSVLKTHTNSILVIKYRGTCLKVLMIYVGIFRNVVKSAIDIWSKLAWNCKKCYWYLLANFKKWWKVLLVSDQKC